MGLWKHAFSVAASTLWSGIPRDTRGPFLLAFQKSLRLAVVPGLGLGWLWSRVRGVSFWSSNPEVFSYVLNICIGLVVYSQNWMALPNPFFKKIILIQYFKKTWSTLIRFVYGDNDCKAPILGIRPWVSMQVKSKRPEWEPRNSSYFLMAPGLGLGLLLWPFLLVEQIS